jgi:hypothetical protein
VLLSECQGASSFRIEHNAPAKHVIHDVGVPVINSSSSRAADGMHHAPQQSTRSSNYKRLQQSITLPMMKNVKKYSFDCCAVPDTTPEPHLKQTETVDPPSVFRKKMFHLEHNRIDL